jgi:hypothetical protein
MAESRDNQVYMAKLAEQAERYDGAIPHATRALCAEEEENKKIIFCFFAFFFLCAQKWSRA